MRDENFQPKKRPPGCYCDDKPIEPHPCPFKAEIYGDKESLCECCNICAESCRLDT